MCPHTISFSTVLYLVSEQDQYIYAMEETTVEQPQEDPTYINCPVDTQENEDRMRKRWSDSSKKQLEALQKVEHY